MIMGTALFAGWVCGALGIGGGIIYNALFMQWDMPPKVGTSTSMYLITWAAFCNSVTYAITGELLIDYAGWIASFCLVSTAIGMTATNWLLRTLGRQSPLTMLLCFILAVSTCFLLYFGIYMQVKNNEELWEMKGIC